MLLGIPYLEAEWYWRLPIFVGSIVGNDDDDEDGIIDVSDGDDDDDDCDDDEDVLSFFLSKL